MNEFEKVIKAHLDQRAATDKDFAAKYTPESDDKKRNITACCNYIIGEVKKSGRQGFADAEVFGMAVHFYDEKIEGPTTSQGCKVVVNQEVQLSEEEKEKIRTPLAELLRLPEDGGAPELLNGYCVHTRTLNRIMKHDEIKLLPNGVITATDKGTSITYQLTLENTGEAPKGPNFESVLTPPEERTPVKNIGLNARFLATLAEAMGVPDNIKMNFTTANRAIFIEPTDETNHSIGVIMPINLQPSLPGFGDEGDDEEPTNE